MMHRFEILFMIPAKRFADKIYKAFLDDFEKNNNSFIEAQLDLEKFYKQNLLRDAHEGKALFFIKYPIHDVYFATKKKEDEFFKKLNTSVELFIKKHDLIHNLNLTHSINQRKVEIR